MKKKNVLNIAVICLIAEICSAGGLDISTWRFEGKNGTRDAVFLTLNGSEGKWLSPEYRLKTNALYRFSFDVKGGDDYRGGSVMAGPGFANQDVDLAAPHLWARRSSLFAASESPLVLHLGQYLLNGTFSFKNLEMNEVAAVHERFAGFTLGAGESLAGNQYAAQAGGLNPAVNASRVLLKSKAYFNSGRWVLGWTNELMMRYGVEGRSLTNGSVYAAFYCYQSGGLEVLTSPDGKSWTSVGRVDRAKPRFELPASCFPAKELYVRLACEKGASFQVTRVNFEGQVDGPAQVPAAIGTTRYFDLESNTAEADILSLGGLGNGVAPDAVTLAFPVEPLPAGTKVSLAFSPLGVQPNTFAVTNVTQGPVSSLVLPYTVPGPGRWLMRVKAGDQFDASAEIIIAALHAKNVGERLPSSKGLALWRADSGWKIGRAMSVPAKSAEALEVSLAANEAEAVQLVVTPSKDLHRVQVRASALECNGEKIPASAVAVWRVGYIAVSRVSDAFGCAGDWPDPLLPQTREDTAKAGMNQPYWIRVKAPKGTKPGLYRGSVTVSADDGLRAEVPLTVRVYDFALPDDPACKSSFGMSIDNAWRYQKAETKEQKQKIFGDYLRLYADAKIAPYYPTRLAEWTCTWSGEGTAAIPVFDWTRWDREMEKNFESNHFSSFVFSLKGPGHWDPTDGRYKEGTPEYDILFDRYAKGIEAHLRDKGWLDKAFVYWFDEPPPSQWPRIHREFGALKRCAPGLRRSMTSAPVPGLTGEINLWIPMLNHYQKRLFNERLALGEEVWWYLSCDTTAPTVGGFIDNPGTSLRVWLWQTWKAGLSGVLIWDLLNWDSRGVYPDKNHPQNPYTDPMSWSGDGNRAYGNGEGRLVYPPFAAAGGTPSGVVLDPPVGTVRLEALRDGIEDFGYFDCLNKLLKEKGAMLSETDRKAYEALLTVPANITDGLDRWTQDPAPIRVHRAAVAGAIEKLMSLSAPRHVNKFGDYPIRPTALTDVTVTGGFWLPRFETNRLVTVWTDFNKCDETGRNDNFAKAGRREQTGFKGTPYDDSDVYKVIEGAAYTLATHPDPKLDAYLDNLIANIAKAQEADGYLYTARTLGVRNGMAGPVRWEKISGSHELYNLGHLYEAAAAHYTATGKKTLLNVALKSADLVERTFGLGKNQIRQTSGHEEIEIGLCKLYRVTGDVRYLNLAKTFLDLRGRSDLRPIWGPGSQDHLPVLEQKEAVGHAVRAGYLYAGMADVAALADDPAYVRAIDGLWENVVGKKLHLNGGIGANRSEAFGENYDLPNISAYLETCASIANMFWNQRMFLLHGDSKYIDVLERTLYNGFLSGISLGGDEFFYPNPLASRGGYKRSKWFGCSCCPVNIVRFIPQIATYIYAHRQDTLYWNLFIENEASISLQGGKVHLRQTTAYPWDGASRLEVTPEHDGAVFALNVRIPGWAVGRPVPSDLYTQVIPGSLADADVRVNGQSVPVKLDQGYCRIRRTWKKGDIVTAAFKMPIRRIQAHPAVKEDAGLLAIERGPIVYCAEGVDNGERVLDKVIPADAAFTVGTCTILGQDFPSLKTRGFSAARGVSKLYAMPTEVTLVPYFAWCHRGAGEMQTWFPTVSNPSDAPLAFSPSASYCWTSDTPASLCDERLPTCSSDCSIPRMTFWNHKGSDEWVRYELPEAETIRGVSVYWFDDSKLKFGECALPASWRVRYRETKDGPWQDAEADAFPVHGDAFCEVIFRKPIHAQVLQLDIRLRSGFSAGLLEWRLLP